MDYTEIYQQISGALYFIAQLILLTSSIIYVTKIKSNEGILMLLGSLFSMIVSALYHAQSFILSNANEDFFSSIYMVLGIVGTISTLLFTIGFSMAVAKWVKTLKP